MDSSRQTIDYSKIPHEDVTDTYRYVNLPKQFFYDRADGNITPLMFDCLAWMWARAGYKTGIACRVTADTILDDLFPAKAVPKKERPSVRTIQRVLKQLQDFGYVTLPKKYKHRKNYSIYVHGYVALVDGRKLSLRPKEIKFYGDRDDEFVAPDDAPNDGPVSHLCRTSVASLVGIAGEQAEQEETNYNNNDVVVAEFSSGQGNPETGIPGDGSEAYAKIVSELTGEAVQPVKPKPKPPVQPVDLPVQSVQPSAKNPVMKSPPVPASPPKLWETWTGDFGGFSESRIRFCVWHQIVQAKNDYYAKNLSVGYIRRQIQKLNEDTPQGDLIPKPKAVKPVADPACLKCRGTGQLKARFVKVPGQRIEQTIIPSCDCLHIPGAGK